MLEAAVLLSPGIFHINAIQDIFSGAMAYGITIKTMA